ncbi:MAG TPA: glycosyltransferase family 39 protein [Bryobacteraceae bacterium]|nr:glycosyltransferase family 39 protein [Bryobacteraceae bacterium]
MLQRRADWLAALFCVMFVAIGSLWIGEIGLQNDEVLFGAGIYPPFGDSISIFGKRFPMMVMTYVGTLKSLLYTPILKLWDASAVSVRLPVLLIGGLTVGLFYAFVKRTLSVRAALVATALLATDTTFVLTTRWDWGPVVLQHLCLVAGMLAGIRFYESRRVGWLFTACFLFGLGVWDKTLFLWCLIGLAAGLIVVFPRKTLQAITWKAVVTAALGFLIGAFPLIRYNVRNNWATFRENAAWSPERFPYKFQILTSTLDGSGMFGLATRERWDGPVRPPDDRVKTMFTNFLIRIGEPRKNAQVFLLMFVLLLLPFVWRTPARDAVLFVLVFCSVAWTQMVFTKDAGGSVHHTILMWPLPHLAFGAVLAEASRRAGRFGVRMLAAVVGVVCLCNVAVTGSHYTAMLLNGPNVAWTDAIYPAVDAIPSMRPAPLCVMDWGLYEPIRLLHKGKTDSCNSVDPTNSPIEFKKMIDLPAVVFMTHVTGLEFDAGVNERFVAGARSHGYEPTDRRVFYDRNGRAIIEIFKLFRPQRP